MNHFNECEDMTMKQVIVVAKPSTKAHRSHQVEQLWRLDSLQSDQIEPKHRPDPTLILNDLSWCCA